jgi:hypothetical protein
MRTMSSFIGLLAASTLAATAHARIYEQHVAADPKGEVDVSNVAGSIEITAWDQPEVAVRADIDADWQHVEVSSSKGFVSVRVTGHPTSWFWGGYPWTTGAARLQVWVPRGSEIDVSAVSAQVISKGVLGVERLHSVSGDITADVSGADTEVNTVSGEVRLQGNGQPGHLEVRTVSGDVRLANAAGDLEATTISGSLSAALAPAGTVRVHTTSGSFTLTGRFARSATLEAGTISGDMNVRAGAEAGYVYEVRTFSGDVDDCFGREATPVSLHGPGKVLTGTLGSGGANLRIRTLSGSVSLCDH